MSACHAEDREFESRRPRQISIPKNFPTRKGGKFFAFIEKFGGALKRILFRAISNRRLTRMGRRLFLLIREHWRGSEKDSFLCNKHETLYLYESRFMIGHAREYSILIMMEIGFKFF